MNSNFQLRHVPWMTVALVLMVWSIHLLTRWFNDPEAVREMFGIDFSNAISYISHAFIHADILHITGNTVGLLIFGSVAEAQVGRRWYGAILFLSILAGSVGALLFHEFAGTRPDDRVIGLSVAVSAYTIVGIGAFVCHWGWWKESSMVTLSALGLLLLTALARLWDEGQGNISDMSAPVLLLLTIAGVLYSRNRRSVAFHRLTPMYWVLILLLADIFTAGWAYSTVGHLSGSVVGAVLTFPVLHRSSPTEATVVLKGVLYRRWSWTSERVRSLSETRWLAPTLLAVTLFGLVIMLRATEFR